MMLQYHFHERLDRCSMNLYITDALVHPRFLALSFPLGADMQQVEGKHEILLDPCAHLEQSWLQLDAYACSASKYYITTARPGTVLKLVVVDVRRPGARPLAGHGGRPPEGAPARRRVQVGHWLCACMR